MRGWDADGGDEYFGAVLDRNFDELVELSVGVVVVGLAGGAADLGKGEVDAEGCVLVGQVFLEFVDDLGLGVRVWYGRQYGGDLPLAAVSVCSLVLLLCQCRRH